jgi:hypothetical protein
MFGLDKDTGNLIIIISVLGILTCLCLWLLRSLNIILKNHDIKKVENYLSWIGVSLAFLILLMIFVTAGDLGILLLVGSIVSFLLMVVGLIAKNTKQFSDYIKDIFFDDNLWSFLRQNLLSKRGKKSWVNASKNFLNTINLNV